jgi:hypothetical protein
MSALFAAMTKCMNWIGDMGRAYFLSGMKECSILYSHLSGELTKCPVKKRIVVISYSRLWPHL